MVSSGLIDTVAHHALKVTIWCRGFDPLRLFQNPSVRPWLVEGELYNGRVAMLAAAGIFTATTAQLFMTQAERH